MNIETTKLELMRLLLQTQQENVLTKLKKVFDDETVDWWNEMDESEQRNVEIGLEQADEEEFISHKKVMNKFNKWH